MDNINAKELLRKYRLGILTEEEKAILESWYLHQLQHSTDSTLSEEELKEDFSKLSEKVLENIKPNKKKDIHKYIKLSIAAASILIISFVVALYSNRDSDVLTDKDKLSSLEENKIVPGSKKAILTLGNNTQVVLDEGLDGRISDQGGIQIKKTEDGKVLYTVVEGTQTNSTEIVYNSISTPSGGEYEIQLADGTKVWLNALSSIRFPTKFQGNSRQVEVTGEVFFDVSHNAKMPFQVVTGRQLVEVLGTQFNINAYEKEIKTSLLEGSVRVSSTGSNKHRILKPGDQSILFSSSSMDVKQVDMEQVLAWKNGYFIFDNDDFEGVMNQIERWYDVTVDYSDPVQNIKLGGAIARKRNLQDVLSLLELSANVKFKLEGRKVIVSK